MTSQDRSYYASRARQERDRANCCEDHGIAKIHLTLANAYDEQARQAGGYADPVPSRRRVSRP